MSPTHERPGAEDRRPVGRSGFSLIELLVSILIMATLMGILMPALPRIRDSARRAACGSNLRTIGLSLEMYMGEHKDIYPQARYMPPPWLSGDTDPPFNVAIDHYLEPDSEVYKCPGDDVVFDYEFEDSQGKARRSGMSYTYIVALGGRRFEETFFFKFLHRTTTNTPVLHDFDGGSFDTQDGGVVTVDFFHKLRNVLFVDGHVDRAGK